MSCWTLWNLHDIDLHWTSDTLEGFSIWKSGKAKIFNKGRIPSLSTSEDLGLKQSLCRHSSSRHSEVLPALLMLNCPRCHRHGNRWIGISEHLMISRSVRPGSIDLVWIVNHRNRDEENHMGQWVEAHDIFSLWFTSWIVSRACQVLHMLKQSEMLVFILEPKEASLFYESRWLLFFVLSLGGC